MNTLIELYDERAIENILAPDMFRPRRIVYLCPGEVIRDRSRQETLAAFFRCRGWEPELILSGLPYTLSGEEGPQAGRIRGVAANIGKAAGLPVEFTDERLSSQEAKRSLRESGMSERDMRGKIDMIAASVFLQAWLDARHAGER